uniref:Uncharacterized protein n=1 Tax=Rhizophora mucronata TaxID=61149 RepID=A0A2P2NQQ4_RHIMU
MRFSFCQSICTGHSATRVTQKELLKIVDREHSNSEGNWWAQQLRSHSCTSIRHVRLVADCRPTKKSSNQNSG